MSGNETRPSYPPERFNEYTIGCMSSALACILYGSIYIVVAGVNLSLLRRRGYRILFSFTLFQIVITTLYLSISLYSEPTELLSMFGLSNVNNFGVLSSWNSIARDAAFLINTWTSDAFLLYRCYVVWRSKKYIIILPALIYVATFGASIAWLTVDSIPGALYSTRNVQVAGTTVFSCSAALNVTASVLISGRLLYYRHAISQAAGSQQGRFYLGYIAMTLESAILYTVFVILTAATFTTQNPLQAIFFSVLAIIQVLAPSLIVYRIASGISFETDGPAGGRSSFSLCSTLGVLCRRSGAHDVSDAPRVIPLALGCSISKSDPEGQELDEVKEEQAQASSHP